MPSAGGSVRPPWPSSLLLLQSLVESLSVVQSTLRFPGLALGAHRTVAHLCAWKSRGQPVPCRAPCDLTPQERDRLTCPPTLLTVRKILPEPSFLLCVTRTGATFHTPWEILCQGVTPLPWSGGGRQAGRSWDACMFPGCTPERYGPRVHMSVYGQALAQCSVPVSSCESSSVNVYL